MLGPHFLEIFYHSIIEFRLEKFLHQLFYENNNSFITYQTVKRLTLRMPHTYLIREERNQGMNYYVNI